MEKPLCKICGERHWSRELHGTKGVNARVNNPVNARVNTPVVNARVNTACAECETLRAEVRKLKRWLAEANAEIERMQAKQKRSKPALEKGASKETKIKRARDDMAGYMRERRAANKPKPSPPDDEIQFEG